MPDDPQALLRKNCYADPTFLSLLFDWVDDRIYRAPQAGLRWAKVLPDLALRVPEASGPNARMKHRAQLVQAWARLGGALRACSDHQASDRAYSNALKIADNEAIPAWIRADTDRRLSFLRACEGKHEIALKLASGAVDSLRDVDPPRPVVLGEALIAKGYVLANEQRRYTESLSAFGEALELAGDGKGSAAVQRLHETACINLAAVAVLGSLGGVRTAFLYIRRARASVKGAKKSVALYRLLWVEALIHNRTGTHAKAERLYRRALAGFEACGLIWEAALVGLDLAALHHLCGEFVELEELARTTFNRFSSLSGANRQTLCALQMWVDAVTRRSWQVDDEQQQSEALRTYDRLHTEARELILSGVLRGARRKAKRP